MQSLTPAEKIELVTIPVAVLVAALVAPRSGLNLEIGTLIGAVALLLLLQGFVRDLWLLVQSRRKPSPQPARNAACMCVESAAGLTGVIVGVALTGIGLSGHVLASPVGIAVGVGVTMTAGYLLKDFVFEWSPWKIYREKNHAQVIIRWRR